MAASREAIYPAGVMRRIGAAGWLVIAVGCVHPQKTAERTDGSDRARSDATSPLVVTVAEFDAGDSGSNEDGDRAFERFLANRHCQHLLGWFDSGGAGSYNARLIPSACLPLLAGIARGGAHRAMAAKLLDSYCDEELKEVERICPGYEPWLCADKLRGIELAGERCSRQAERVREVIRKANDVEVRLGPILAEAHRLIGLRNRACEKQNRDSGCHEWASRLKEQSTRPDLDTRDPLHHSHSPPSECDVVVRRQCPSTSSRDPETIALVKEFETNFEKIDDGERRRGVCRAWQDASTWCRGAFSRPPVHDGGLPTAAPTR